MATYESKKYAIPGANITDIDATAVADGSVSDSEYQFINSLTSNAQTQITARLPLAGGTMTGDLNLGDNVDINFGDSADLKIYHDSNNSIIEDAGTGSLVFEGHNFSFENNANSETIAAFTPGGSAQLYHSNAVKLATASTGVTITGALGGWYTLSTSDPSGGNDGDFWFKYST